MAVNHKQRGKVMSYANATGVAIVAGQAVAVGARVGVALTDIANGASGELAMEEVFELPKATGVIGQGVTVYWDADGNPVGGTSGAGAMTTTSSSNTEAGYAFAAAGNTDATVLVKLRG